MLQRIKLLNKIKEKGSIKSIFLPLTFNSKNKTSSLKELNKFENCNNLKTQNNSNISNTIDYPRNIVSFPKFKNKKNNISLSTLGNNKNNLDYNSTSPNDYNKVLSKYIKTQNKFPNKKNSDIKNIEIFKTTYNKEKDNKIIFNLFPTVKKLSLRNIICDDNFNQKEIKKVVNRDKEKENSKKCIINNLKKYDNLSNFVKFKNNKIIKRNHHTISIEKYKTFNQKIDSSEFQRNNIDNEKNYSPKKNIKKNCLNRNNILLNHNNSSFRTYFLHKFTPKRKKNNNDDILNLLDQ